MRALVGKIQSFWMIVSDIRPAHSYQLTCPFPKSPKPHERWTMMVDTDSLCSRPASSATPQKPNLKILDINLTAVMYTIKLALFYFRKQFNSAVAGGEQGLDSSLVLQGSLAGYVDQPGSPQYNAAKFGLRGTMRCLRRTALQHGTRVNYIAPW